MRWRTDEGSIVDNCIVFFKVKEPFGGLSNMAGGYPLDVAGVHVPSAEALYQACRFPHRPDWQRDILAARNPMGAKMAAKKEGRRAHHSRGDWSFVAVDVMRWVLRVKLAQHSTFRDLLLRTGERAIVERSRRDRAWGAVEQPDGTLEGRNELGRLLVELRSEITCRQEEERAIVTPPAVVDFLLLGKPVGNVSPLGEQ
jgi:type I restriction enzyme S subunit